MTTPDSDAHECLTKLEALKAQIDAIMELIGEQRRLYPPQKEQAQDMLRGVKDELSAEYRRTRTSRARADMDSIEATCYAPAIRDAYVHLEIRTNSVPGTVWIHDLYEVAMDLEFAIRPLREKLENKHSA